MLHGVYNKNCRSFKNNFRAKQKLRRLNIGPTKYASA